MKKRKRSNIIDPIVPDTVKKIATQMKRNDFSLRQRQCVKKLTSSNTLLGDDEIVTKTVHIWKGGDDEKSEKQNNIQTGDLYLFTTKKKIKQVFQRTHRSDVMTTIKFEDIDPTTMKVQVRPLPSGIMIPAKRYKKTRYNLPKEDEDEEDEEVNSNSTKKNPIIVNGIGIIVNGKPLHLHKKKKRTSFKRIKKRAAAPLANLSAYNALRKNDEEEDNKLPISSSRRNWTQSEHNIFIEAFKQKKTVEEMCKLFKKKSWQQIDTHRFLYIKKLKKSHTRKNGRFPVERSNKATTNVGSNKKQKKRYNKKGRWSKAERKKFMKALQEDRSVKEMCELIPTRTYRQIYKKKCHTSYESESESSSSEDESESESTKKMKLQKKKRYNKKGRWSKAEHKKFMKAFKENKTTREMCELITTRTYDQICNHRFYFESKVRSSPTSSSSEDESESQSSSEEPELESIEVEFKTGVWSKSENEAIMQLINARMGINKIDEVIVTRSREQILNKIKDMGYTRSNTDANTIDWVKDIEKKQVNRSPNKTSSNKQLIGIVDDTNKEDNKHGSSNGISNFFSFLFSKRQ